MIKYVIDREQRLVKARMSGATGLVGLVTHIANLAKDPAFDPSFNLLFEVAPDATFSILPIEAELQKLIKQWTTRRQGVKWAFWAPFGTAYAHLEFALGILYKGHVQMRLFDNEESAMNWLNETAPDQG
ncbi:MAG: hypothetical protein WCD79_19985 [Chthoniobacteraceae bacterium]